MDAERYKKIDEIFDAALELQAHERADYLHRVCGTDSELRREVESLLDARNEVGNFIQTPALEAAAKSFAQQEASLPLIGQSIKHYKIISLAGAGGMGEVYIAEDTQLGRKVAVKILPSQFTRDPDRVARFQRESRAASSLNHPNIITIHDMGQDRNTFYIVTEFIEGDTLRKKISRGKLVLKEAIEVTLQVAAALDAAHKAGIVHRDIKPENIMVRHDGYVKVLDFGLAKLTEKRKSDTAMEGEAHLSTQTGVVMGTVSYMSPEQASGQEVDHRTDIFSLGVVFYEAVTGKNPFKRSHLATTLNAIMEDQPQPITSSNAAVSFELERIVTRMLEKEKDFRYQTASDLRASLRRLQKNLDSRITASADKISTTLPAAIRKPVNFWWRYAAIAFALLAVFLFAAWLLFPKGKASSDAPRWQEAKVMKLTDQKGLEYFPSLSPDGKSLIYASDVRGDFDIYLQRIGAKKTINLTEGSREDDTEATFSPDGTRIAFRSGRNGGGIFLMSETGESVKQLTNFGYNPAWSPDGKEIACAEDDVVLPGVRAKIPSRMWVVNVATGESRLISEGDAVTPSWSPNGKRIIYGATGLWTMRPDGSDVKPLFKNRTHGLFGKWSPDGKYLYYINSRNRVPYLWRVAIDEATADILGEPELIPTPASFIYQLSFSKDGKRLAFIQDLTNSNTYRLSFDPMRNRIIGQPEPVTRSTDSAYSPTISPNGELLLFTKRSKLLALKLNSAVPEQLTEGAGIEVTPRWSPDGKRIAFQSSLSGNNQIHIMNADGSGQQQITKVPEPGAVYPIWSPDGTRLAYSVFSSKTFILDLNKPFDQQTPEETPFFPNSEAYFIAWDWSPDGKYLVGNQGENGADTKGIYLYSLATKTYEEISDIKFTDLFSRPIWLNDSRRLLYSTKEKIFVLDIQTKKAQEIFSSGRIPIEVYSLTKDNRFIYSTIAAPESDIWMLSLEEEAK
jgi:serine/threonine protein kinase/Tol biopolymer transport system component